MKYFGLFALLCSMLPGASDNTAPPAGNVVKDVKGSCQILVPENWTPSSENTGSAVLQDPSNAIAVVTSQPGQAFKPLTESMQKLMRIPKDKMFENSAKRIFYQDKVGRDLADTNAFSAMVPASCRSVNRPHPITTIGVVIPSNLSDAAVRRD